MIPFVNTLASSSDPRYGDGPTFPPAMGATGLKDNVSADILQSEDLSNSKDEQGRRRWVIIAAKVPSARRDVARAVMPDSAAVEDRLFRSIGREALTEDADLEFPIGTTTMYSLLLTDMEAERFRAASNAKAVVLPQLMSRAALSGDDALNLPLGLS